MGGSQSQSTSAPLVSASVTTTGKPKGDIVIIPVDASKHAEAAFLCRCICQRLITSHHVVRDYVYDDCRRLRLRLRPTSGSGSDKNNRSASVIDSCCTMPRDAGLAKSRSIRVLTGRPVNTS